MNRRTLKIVPLCITLITTFTCTKSEAPLPAVGNTAPFFAVMDIDGKKVSLADFSGKVVILDFWATWCAPCRTSTRELEKLHEKYKDRDVVILGISLDEGMSAAERVKEFTGKNGLTYRMLVNDGRMSKAFAVRNIPAMFILDKQQRIIKIYPGYLPGLNSMIENEIEELLKG